MRKGLTQTLLTVAVALLGFNAMSAAPIIGNIPDVIIGDVEAGTSSNLFVYPDAFDLDTYVVDDNTSDGAILWSYAASGTAYRINNVPEIGAGDPNAPGGASLAGDTDPAKVDANSRTVTFRNINRSPIGGSNTAPTTSETEVVTLFASDSTTYSQKDFLVYVDNDGADALSTAAVAYTQELAYSFTTSAQGWTSYADLSLGATISHSQGASGLCLEVSLAGVTIAGWESQPMAAANYTTVDLTANSVYQVRLGVTVSGSSAGNSPAWSMTHNQKNTMYSGENIYYGNYGDANAPFPLNTASTAAEKQIYESWVTPIAIQTAQFNAGAFTGAALAENGMRFQLRIIDVDGANYGAETDAGQICWNSIEVRRYDISDLAVESTPYNQTTFQASPGDQGATINPANWSSSDIVSNSTISYTGGVITVGPASSSAWGGSSAGYVELRPGDKTFGGASLVNNLDNFPVAWVSDTLYKVTANLAANDAAGEANPPDFVRVGADAYSNELIGYSAVTTTYNRIGMPKVGTPQPYVYFLFGHSRSAAVEAAAQRIRPRIDIGANASFVESTNVGSIVVSGVRVDVVSGRSAQ